jgi:hypothetical protein
VKHFVGDLVGYVGGGGDGVRGPFLHSGAVDGCFIVLQRMLEEEILDGIAGGRGGVR